MQIGEMLSFPCPILSNYLNSNRLETVYYYNEHKFETLPQISTLSFHHKDAQSA